MASVAAASQSDLLHGWKLARRARRSPSKAAQAPQPESIEIQIHDRRRVKRQQLAQQKPADNRDAEWTAKLRTVAGPERERQCAEHRRERRHDDRTKASQTCIEDRVA